MPPLVSTIIPAYNAERTIRRAIDSALAQDYPAQEVIVVDDASSDATSEIAGSYAAQGVHVLRLVVNHGEGGVLNEGIAIANGDYIAFLDADDEWLPTKLSRQVSLLQSNKNAIMVTCGCRMVDGSGRVIKEFGISRVGVGKADVWRIELAQAWLAKQCLVVRASAFKQVGLFDTTIPVAADQDMLIRLAMAGEVEFVDDYLTIQHDTPGSLTKTYIRHIDDYVLPMIKSHITRKAAEITDEQRRWILGERYRWVGRHLYRHGYFLRGAKYLLSPHALKDNVLPILWYLTTASAPARATKRALHLSAETRPVASCGPSSDSGASLLQPQFGQLVNFPSGSPILVLTIDTEAEFDWTGPRLRTQHEITNVRKQAALHEFFDRVDVRPVYLVDYAVATNPEAYAPLREIVSSGRCEIGAHLQSWETPPFLEALNDKTSFNHNLPGWLQKEKLARLTEAIVSNLETRPISYRAGRWGVGEEIAWILEELGYSIDLSVRSGVNLSRFYGPDFRTTFNRPYWFGRQTRLLEIPEMSAFHGLLGERLMPRRLATNLYEIATRPRQLSAHIPGALARFGLLERIPLTPEGVTLDELKRATRLLLAQGHRVFTFVYHSSSLVPGNTPYVRSGAQLNDFIRTITSYLEFFCDEIGGRSLTASELRAFVIDNEASLADAEHCGISQLSSP